MTGKIVLAALIAAMLAGAGFALMLAGISLLIGVFPGIALKRYSNLIETA